MQVKRQPSNGSGKIIRVKNASKLKVAQSVVRRSIRHLAKICGTSKKYHQNVSNKQKSAVKYSELIHCLCFSAHK